MNENVYEDMPIQNIASQLNLSYALFRRNFKKYTNESPARYYNDIKLNKAKQMLVESTDSIKEISFKLQFTSLEYFSTSFKRMTGLTPSEFRLSERTIR